MANLIVDEGNTLCKIAVVDKSEVLYEASAGKFDMALVEQISERFQLEKR